MGGTKLSVTLEAPSARRLANDIPLDKDYFESQKDVLWDLTDDGTRIWKQPDDETTQMTDSLCRVWQERGDFSQLTLDSIHTAPTTPTELEVSPDTSDEPITKDEPQGKDSISSEDLWEMKLKMAQHLGAIGVELAAGLDLLNLVLGPLAPDTVDTNSLPMPNGGLAPAIHSSDHLPPQAESTTLIDAAVSLMRKQKTTKNVSDVLRQASEELGKEVGRSQDQWNALLELREAGWDMRPKGVKAGVDVSLIGKGAERAAKEVGIVFANPEAAEVLRASSIASLEPASLSSLNSQLPKMKFPTRPRRRLVISLITPEGQPEFFSPWSNYSFQTATSPLFSQDLEMARAEMLEEEIFSEIFKEAQLVDTYSIITSDSSVHVEDLGIRVQIRFEMVEKVASTGLSNEDSPLALLISSIMRLMMTSMYRSRRLLATGSVISKPKEARPKMLKPVLDLIVFYTCTLNVRRLFIQAAQALTPTRLKVDLECEPVLESVAQIIHLLSDTGFGEDTQNKTFALGGMWTLRICEQHSVFFTVACPAIVSLWLPHQSIKISLAQISGVLQREVEECILLVLLDSVQEKGFVATRCAPGFSGVRDDLEIFVTVSFSLRNGVRARVEKLQPTTTTPTPRLLSKYEGKGSIMDWVAEAIPPHDHNE
ncbi:subunit 17 of mediator complex-domain-containing protein [Melampsora americana]|nr:subunit 17 of mediator complex-domain-containing protein [Melampsora americana]